MSTNQIFILIGMSILSFYFGYKTGRSVAAEVIKVLMNNLVYLLVKKDNLVTEEQMKSAIVEASRLFLEKNNTKNNT